MAPSSPFVIGIDLGTTNTAVAYVDTRATPWAITHLPVPQALSAVESGALDTLASSIYFPAEGEQAKRGVVGRYAREQATLNPGRVISSSKSWMCHTKVDRRSPLLPWQGAEDLPLLSPSQAAARILDAIADVWNNTHGEYPFSEQHIVLTVPASFDEVARSLTAEAAQAAGLHHVNLLEEPQAAFYAWLSEHQDAWGDHLSEGQTVLVCDIGGGTSDFSLIAVQADDAGKLVFERKAVGKHLLLGGDNLDLSLAHTVEQAWNTKLGPRDWSRLLASCQYAKEALLSESGRDEYTISVGGSGKSLIGGARQHALTRDAILPSLLDGFLPVVDMQDRPVQHGVGFQEFGLPYEADPAMSKHLAAFLNQHLSASKQSTGPDVVLFNGGFFEANRFKTRVLDILKHWYDREIPALTGTRLDLAVSQGAAYYGMTQRGWGQRIGGGLPRSLLVEVIDQQDQACGVCVASAGMQEGEYVSIDDRHYLLKINQPVEFGVYQGPSGDVVPAGATYPLEGLEALAPIRTMLKVGKKKKKAGEVEVKLESHLTALGTLEVACASVHDERRWPLQFDTRVQEDTPQTDSPVETLADRSGLIEACAQAIRNIYEGDGNPDIIMKTLEAEIGVERWNWDFVFLRELFDVVYALREHRQRSAQHEMRWFNLASFTLRPGYGVAMDDYRVGRLWELFHQGVQHHRNQQVQADWWAMWQHCAGGLSKGQQSELAKGHLAAFRQEQRKLVQLETGEIQSGGRGRKKQRNQAFGERRKTRMGNREAAEFWSLMGALELLDLPTKMELLGIVTQHITEQGLDAAQGKLVWAMGRLAARVPMYGPLNCVVAPKHVKLAFEAVRELVGWDTPHMFALAYMARKTDDRFRDVDDDLRKEIYDFLKGRGAPDHVVELVTEGGSMTDDDKDRVFGGRLPSGLRMA